MAGIKLDNSLSITLEETWSRKQRAPPITSVSGRGRLPRPSPQKGDMHDNNYPKLPYDLSTFPSAQVFFFISETRENACAAENELSLTPRKLIV
jgi:hypothetical protein